MFRNLLFKNLSTYRSFISLRRFNRGAIADKFRKNGLGDESRYLRQEQEEKLRKLKETLKSLEGAQEKLESQIKQANELLSKLRSPDKEEDSSDEETGRS